jgi:hypothetical protein
MSDKDSLPNAGIPFFSIVDENGVSTDGTSASMGLIRSRGMEPICEVSSAGAASGGSSLGVLRYRGIQFYCPITENGVTSDAVSMTTLRQRGIPFFCPVGTDGVATGGTLTIGQLAARGIPYVCLLDSLGSPGGSPASTYTLAAGAGSFVFSGDTMTPIVDYKLPVDAGSFAFTGQTATLKSDRIISAAAGSFAFTGQDVTLTKSSSYTGPGDLVSGATGWWSCARAYTAAFAAGGTAIMDLVDQAGANPVTINILSTGFVDIPAISAWVTANSVTTIRVTKLYDQTGNAFHATNATLTTMPALTLTALNGLPVMTLTAARGDRLNTATTTQAQPFSLMAVAQRTANFTTEQGLVGATPTSIDLQFTATTNQGRASAGSVITATANNSAWHTMTGVLNGASSALVVDGAATTGAGGSNALSAVGLRIGRSSSGGSLDGQIAECGIWPAALDSTQYGNLNTNPRAASVYNF